MDDTLKFYINIKGLSLTAILNSKSQRVGKSQRRER